MNRRNFLKITIVAGLAAAVPITFDSILKHQLPIIWGDGVHDDTLGINAALNGRDFIAERNCVTVRDGVCILEARTFRVRVLG